MVGASLLGALTVCIGTFTGLSFCGYWLDATNQSIDAMVSAAHTLLYLKSVKWYVAVCVALYVGLIFSA